MDIFNSSPSCNLAFTDIYFGSLDLIEQRYQFATREQPSTYQGRSVQPLCTSCSFYHLQSDIHQQNPHSFHSLHEFDIETLILSYAVDTVLPEIPQSVLDEHIPWPSGNDPDKFSTPPNIPFIQQIRLSGSESEIREPTPDSHSSPDDQLTNLPVLSPSPQDLPSITAADPLNLNQTTSDNQTNLAKEIVDDKASRVKHKRVCKRECMKQCHRDSVTTERRREYMRERRKDPVFLERHRKRRREYMRALRKDPMYTMRQNQRKRERYRNDPEFAERLREGQRKRRRESRRKHRQNDPAFAERVRKCSREYHRKLRKNSAVGNGSTVHV